MEPVIWGYRGRMQVGAGAQRVHAVESALVSPLPRAAAVGHWWLVSQHAGWRGLLGLSSAAPDKISYRPPESPPGQEDSLSPGNIEAWGSST